jgi:Flp pilus assembly protein TadD
MTAPSKFPRWAWGLAVIGLLATLATAALAVREWRWRQNLDQLNDALSRRALSQAALLLRGLEAQRPGHPDLLPPRARFLVLIHSPQAPSVWLQVLRSHPDNPEYRVAAVMACLQQNQLSTAASIIETWPPALASGTARPRAALALAFAQGDWPTAERHARTLAEAEPGSRTAALNLAKVQLLTAPSPAVLDRLRQLAADPALRTEACRALFQHALAQHPPDEVAALARFARSFSPAQAELELLVLESLDRAGLPPDEASLRAAWDLCLPQPSHLARLVGWMTQTHRASLAWQWLQSAPPADPWSFPLGLAFTECAIATDHKESALNSLAHTKWPGLEDLRLLCLSRLNWGRSSAPAQLERAIAAARLRPGGLLHLLQVLESWLWEPGLLAVLHARIQSPDPTPREFAVLCALLEKQRDTEGLRRVTLRHLELDPHNPLLLNNAAYFSYLRNTDLDRADAWSAQALAQIPSSGQIASTRALVLLARGDPAAARAVLQSAPPEPSVFFAQALIHQSLQEDIPAAVQNALRHFTPTYPEEITLLQSLKINVTSPP